MLHSRYVLACICCVLLNACAGLQGSALNSQGEPIFAAGQTTPTASSIYTDDNMSSTDRPALQGSLGLSRTLAHAPKNLREQLQALAGTPAPYRLGSGDVLEVRIQQSAPVADIFEELPLNSEGVLDLADLGAYRLQGLSLEQAQRILQDALAAAEPLQHPKVLVRVSQYRSQFVRLQGEIYAPGNYALDATPMSLAEAITRAGGLLEKADLGAISLQRNGQTQSIDLRQLYQWGLSPDEILLRHGDVLIFSPSP